MSESILAGIQKEMVPWVLHNFGNREPWQPLLGVGEELGELKRSFLKRHEGIRGTAQQHTIDMADAVGDIAIFMLDFATASGVDVSVDPSYSGPPRHAHEALLMLGHRLGELEFVFVYELGDVRSGIMGVLQELAIFCHAEKIKLLSQVQETWEIVRKRDFKADPKTGGGHSHEGGVSGVIEGVLSDPELAADTLEALEEDAACGRQQDRRERRKG